MKKDAQLDPLLDRIAELAPEFGRARPDLEAVVSRARGGDHRGVLQNTRLVVETLLRAMIAEKSQTPGKQTLEQLLGKMTAELPTHVQVHMRTIQAWGNVGAHDYAERLSDPGVSVDRGEALASLNALVPILEWYRQSQLLPEPAAVEPPKTHRVALWVGLGIALLLALGAGAAMFSRGTEQPVDPRQELDQAYRAGGDVPPPAACRAKDPQTIAELASAVRRLANGKPGGARSEDRQAQARLEQLAQRETKSAEGWSLLARARLYAGAPDPSAAIARALDLCPGWAEPHNVQGNLLLLSGNAASAEVEYRQAAELEPSYLAPRFNLALAAMKANDPLRARQLLDTVVAADVAYPRAQEMRAMARFALGDLEGALADVEAAVERDPKNGSALLLLGQVREKHGDAGAAREAYCRAKSLGIERAATLCP